MARNSTLGSLGTYIITGAAGLIGSVLLAKLNSLGINNIWIVDALGSSEKWKNIRDKSFNEYFEKQEFLSLVQKNKLPKKIAAIIHMGACSATSELNLDYLYHNNFLYTRELALYAVKKKIRFIYASSAATYGSGENGFSDDHQLIPSFQALNPYGYSKQLFDLWALKNNLLKHIVGLKFFNVFGPNENHKAQMQSLCFKAYQQIKNTGRIKLFKSEHPDYGHGEQKRDHIYVKDCAEIVTWLLEQPKVHGIINLGTGEARSWNDYAAAIFRALGKEICIDYVDLPPQLAKQYQYFTQANISKLRSFGCTYRFTPLEASIRDYVLNYLEADARI